MRSAPAKKPRIECDCQPVASIKSGIVAPRFDLSSEMMAAALLVSRGAAVAAAGDFLFSEVSRFRFDILGTSHGRRLLIAAPALCWRSHYPQPRISAEAGKETRLRRDDVSSASFAEEVQSKSAKKSMR